MLFLAGNSSGRDRKREREKQTEKRLTARTVICIYSRPWCAAGIPGIPTALTAALLFNRRMEWIRLASAFEFAFAFFHNQRRIETSFHPLLSARFHPSIHHLFPSPLSSLSRYDPSNKWIDKSKSRACDLYCQCARLNACYTMPINISCECY